MGKGHSIPVFGRGLCNKHTLVQRKARTFLNFQKKGSKRRGLRGECQAFVFKKLRGRASVFLKAKGQGRKEEERERGRGGGISDVPG